MNELLMQGLVFMLVGMSVVFAFLTLLVFAMGISAAFFKRFARLFPEKEQAQSNLTKISTDYTDIAAAVAVARAYSQRSAN